MEESDNLDSRLWFVGGQAIIHIDLVVPLIYVISIGYVCIEHNGFVKCVGQSTSYIVSKF